MAERSSLPRIHDMLESIQEIEKAIKGKSYRDYQRSSVLRSAVERGIEVVSEASRHLARDLKSPHKTFVGSISLASAIFCATNISASTVKSSGRPCGTIYRRLRKRCWR
jgi:hypothetical protein